MGPNPFAWVWVWAIGFQWCLFVWWKKIVCGGCGVVAVSFFDSRDCWKVKKIDLGLSFSHHSFAHHFWMGQSGAPNAPPPFFGLWWPFLWSKKKQSKMFHGHHICGSRVCCLAIQLAPDAPLWRASDEHSNACPFIENWWVLGPWHPIACKKVTDSSGPRAPQSGLNLIISVAKFLQQWWIITVTSKWI